MAIEIIENIIDAEKEADKIVREAKKQANLIIEQAAKNAELIVQEACDSVLEEINSSKALAEKDVWTDVKKINAQADIECEELEKNVRQKKGAAIEAVLKGVIA